MRRSVIVLSHGFQPAYERSFANGLARNDVSVDLVASDRTLLEEIDARVSVVNLRGSQDPSRSRVAKALNLIAYALRLSKKLICSRASAIHLSGMLLGGIGLLARIECRLYKSAASKLILTVHNLQPHDSQGACIAERLRKLYRIPDVIVVHTTKMRHELIERFGVPASRIVVMQHGVDPPPSVSAAARTGTDRLRILMFGSILRYKGVDILLRAVQLCASLPIAVSIVGKCADEAYEKEILGLIEQLSLTHLVEWSNCYVPESEVQGVFEAADVVVLPYRHIDQSGVLFTAFRYGIPVVAFSVGSFAEYVPEYAGVVVIGNAPGDLSAALNDFYEKRMKYDRREIQSLAAGYAWEKTVRALLHLYESPEMEVAQ